MIPSWIFFALLSPAIFTINSYIDKFLLSSRIKDYRGYYVYSAIVGLFLGLLLLFIGGFPILKIRDLILILLTGIISIWSTITYYQAVQDEHMSTLIFYFQLIPVFVLVLSFVFLHEVLSYRQLLGFALIFIPNLIIATEGKFSIKLNKSFYLILLCDIGFAFTSIIFKFVSETNNFISIVGYETLGWFIGGAMIFLLWKGGRDAFFATNKTLKSSTIGVIVANESIYVGSKLVGFFAVTLASVAIVTVIGSTSVLFAIIFGWILTTIAPHIFKEDVSKKGLFNKLILGVVVLIGIYLVS